MAFIFYLFLHLSSPIFADIPQTVFQPVARPYLRVVIDNEICRRLLQLSVWQNSLRNFVPTHGLSVPDRRQATSGDRLYSDE